MYKIINILKTYLRLPGDRFNNNIIRKNLLQAIPFWIGAVLTGLFAIFYANIFEQCEHLLSAILAWHPWMIFILSPLCFVTSWWLVKRFAPYSKGSGIPQVMAAVELSKPKTNALISKLLSLKIIVIKVLSSMVMVLGGGAIGREGPTIQISGSIYKIINKLLPNSWPRISKKNMIMTGAAAGLSAAFNTPLGGIVFAIEELTRTHFTYFKTALFTGVIIAGFLTQSISGSYLYLGFPSVSDVSLWILIPLILVSAICGVLSSYLSDLMLAIFKFKTKLKTHKQEFTFVFCSALIIATLAYFSSEQILGSGKSLITHVLFNKDKHLDWYIPILRMIGTGLSFTSGGAGGIFAPALAGGASVGAVFSELFHATSNESNVLILAGMVAFLVGVTRAPFTSAILVFEMTDRHSILFHLMLAALVASIFAMYISKHSFYDVLKHQYLRDIEVENMKSKIKTLEEKHSSDKKE